MFDPTWQFRQACEFYAENGFVVVDALSQDEVAEMNNVADLFLRDTAGASFGAGGSGLEGESHGNGQLFYPLLGSADDIDRYSAVDKYITHPKTLPIIAHVLGGLKNVRFQEFNWRGYPEGFGVQQSDGSYKSGAKCMAFHPDANNAERFDRRPYGPPDYLSAFFYLTDVSAETPAFSVVPKSHLSRTLTEVRQTLANEYVEYRIEGKAGLCCIVDSATFHTRLDNTSGDGSGGRRIMHIAYARGGWLQLEDGSWRPPSPALFQLCIPKRLAASVDPLKRKLFSLWSASMCEWAANDFDPSYIAGGDINPTRRAPRPGH